MPRQFSPEEIRHMNDLMETLDPRMWRACYPRIYEEPRCGVYYSPKQVARQLCGIRTKYMHGMPEEAPA